MRSRFSLAAAGLVLAITGAAQTPDIPASAAIVFRGTVLAQMNETTRAPGEIAITRITLRVDDGVRAACTGETLTIRQWNVAPDEYRVGETLVMFLHAPSDGLGLTSPTGGRSGHRRVEEVPAEALNALRAMPNSATAPPASSDQSQRATRTARP
jgi:hypothetical protein